MNPMPALSADELAALRKSIEEDGVIYPVLLDTTGQIIDGFHRKQIADELGIDCPTHILPVTPERADTLRITLNLARRQMTTELWCDLVRQLAEPHREMLRAEAQRSRSETVSRARRSGGVPRSEAHLKQGRAKRVQNRSREVLAERVNADLKAIGINKTVGGSTVERIVRTGSSTEGRKSKPKQPDPRTVAMNKSMRSTREANAYYQYQSMHNAPRGRINLPFIRHAAELNRLLVEISGLDPEVAVTQIPIDRCLHWQVQDAEWWLRFTKLCEARRLAETPDVPPMNWRRGERLSMPKDGEVPTAQDQLSPQQAAVFGYLQQCPEPQLLLEIANATRIERSSVAGALDRLQRYGMIAEVNGSEIKSKLYQVAS